MIYGYSDDELEKLIVIEGHSKLSKYGDSDADGHATEWLYDISYEYNGLIYKGTARQYIHWAHSFIMEYYSNIEKEGSRIYLRVRHDNPSLYYANMDFSLVYEYGTNCNHLFKNNFPLIELEGVSKGIEIEIKDKSHDNRYLFGEYFRLLCCGYRRFLINLDRYQGCVCDIDEDIGWFSRYLSSFTNKTKEKIIIVGNNEFIKEAIRLRSSIATDCEYERSNALNRLRQS